MSTQITSQIIGKLTQDDRFSDWWKSDSVEIPFFNNQKLYIIFSDFKPQDDANFIVEADEALTNFLQLNEDDRNAISNLALQNCNDFLDLVGADHFDEALSEIKDPNDIWKFIRPKQIYISRRPYGDQDIYVQISCECDWEEEHGLQLVFRQGKKLTRISDNDGHLTEADAYDKPDEEDELLSRF